MWWRIPIGAIVNVVSWVAIGTVGLIALRVAWPEYAAVERAMTFDLGMMVARLGVSAVASVLAAWLAGVTVRDPRIAPLAGGFVLLALFVPVHISLWEKFPLWYHLTFLASLPLLALAGGALARRA